MAAMNPRLAIRHLALAALLAVAAAPALAARDVVLVLDNSGSMRLNDPARLAAPAVEEFIKAQPPDTRVAMILFTADAELVMPLTPTEVAADGDAQRALQRFTYRGRWTQIAAGIERALYELRNEGRPEARRAIVLMTDGLIDTGDAAKDGELNQWLRQELAAQAARDKVGIFGIAFTERADYQLLQSLAATTDAQYFRVLNAGGIGKALQGIEAALGAVPPAPAVSQGAPTPAPAAPADEPAAEPEATPPPAAPASGRRLWLAWIAGLFAALAAGLALWWRLRHHRADSATAEAVARAPAPAPRDSGPQAVLYDNLERYELGDRPVVIGRAGGTDPTRHYIVVPEKTVGRWHATIERRGQTFWVRDEGSVNGTFVNGERVVGERPLKHRDQVRFHTHQFEFEIPELGDMDRTVMHASTSH
jgi:hypothetical protein